MAKPIINILLASYNGEKFIAEQLESIIKQTYSYWQLYIRDDGSSDSTLNIIAAYHQEDARINLIKDELGNLGSVQNFNALLQYKKDVNYIMFCDQDDVWLPSKIEDTLREMLKLEQKYSVQFPLLIHTNFMYADLFLKPIESKKKFQPTIIEEPVLSNVLCQNSVYGCTIMINKELAQITGTIPVEAENHDYWLALVASAFGKIIYLNKRTVLYRQHGSNLSTQFDFNSFTKRFKRIFIDKKNFDDVRSKFSMAVAFKRMYYAQLSKYNKKVVNDFIKLSQSKNAAVFIHNLKNGTRRQTFNQTLLFYITALLSKKNNMLINMAVLLTMFAVI